MALYLKYRPQTLDEIRGNEEAVTALQGFLADPESCPHVFLLSGPTGCGKTTLARILARELGCVGGDLREIDTADFRGIDTIRAIRRQSEFLPMEGRARGWIIDECQKLTGDAQSALLKFLEDTPTHVYVFLCTTDPQKLLPTIRGRCSELTVRPLTEMEMIRLLRSVAKAEGVRLSRPIYQQIAVNSLGHPRNALQILEQVIRVPEDQRVKVAERVAAEQSQTIELCRALLRGAAWKQVAGILKGLEGQDPEGIRRQVMGYFKSVLLGGENDLAAAILEVFVEPFYDSGWPGLVLACYTAVRGE